MGSQPLVAYLIDRNFGILIAHGGSCRINLVNISIPGKCVNVMIILKVMYFKISKTFLNSKNIIFSSWNPRIGMEKSFDNSRAQGLMFQFVSKYN